MGLLEEQLSHLWLLQVQKNLCRTCPMGLVCGGGYFLFVFVLFFHIYSISYKHSIKKTCLFSLQDSDLPGNIGELTNLISFYVQTIVKLFGEKILQFQNYENDFWDRITSMTWQTRELSSDNTTTMLPSSPYMPGNLFFLLFFSHV